MKHLKLWPGNLPSRQDRFMARRQNFVSLKISKSEAGRLTGDPGGASGDSLASPSPCDYFSSTLFFFSFVKHVRVPWC